MLLVSGFPLLVVFVVTVEAVESRAGELERTGIRKVGTVVETRDGREGGSVVVEFQWRGERRERIHLDGGSPDYEVGQRVVVLIDPSDADRVSLRGEDNQAPWSVTLMIALLAAAVGTTIVGAAALARTSRQRLILGRHPWQRFDLEYVEVPGLRGVYPPAAPRLGRPASRWRRPHVGVDAGVAAPEAGLRGAESVDLAGPVPGYVVVRVPGHDALASARPPVLGRDERRWRRSLEQARTGPRSAARAAASTSR